MTANNTEPLKAQESRGRDDQTVTQCLDQQVRTVLLAQIDNQADRDLLDRADSVWPPVETETYLYYLRADGRFIGSVKVRPKRPHEPAPEQAVSEARQRRLENDDYGQAPEVPPEHQPDVPSDVEWSEYRSYRCRFCRFECLNRLDSPYSENDMCRACYPFEKAANDSCIGN